MKSCPSSMKTSLTKIIKNIDIILLESTLILTENILKFNRKATVPTHDDGCSHPCLY